MEINETSPYVLPRYEGGRMRGCCHVGDNAWLTDIADTDESEYRAYLECLQRNGFRLHREYQLHTVPSATLQKNHLTVDIWFTPIDGVTHITVQENNMYSLIPTEPDSSGETITSPKLAVVGDREACMCLVLRLSDGRLILFDSGNPTDRMVEELTAVMKHLAPDPGHITVAAWVLTHGHHDHAGGFTKLIPQKPEWLTVQSVLCNLMAPGSAEDATVPAWGNYCRGCFAGLEGTAIYRVHPGYAFTFGDAKLEILSTQENFFGQYPTWSEGSIVTRVTIGETVIMVPADSPERQSVYLSKLFGQDLKCDIVQAIHHGNFGATPEINLLFDPKLVIYCTSEKYFREHLRQKPYNRTNLFALGTDCVFGDDYAVIVNLPYQSYKDTKIVQYSSLIKLKPVSVQVKKVMPLELGGVYQSRMILDHVITKRDNVIQMNHGTVKAGATLGGDTHAEDEIYYILSGKGKLRLDDQVINVEKDQVIFIPAGVFHALDNAGSSEDMTILTFWRDWHYNDAYAKRVELWGTSFRTVDET